MLKYKIVLAGAKNVGKSSLIARFCDNIFSESMLATIGVAFKTKKIKLDEKKSVQLNIWDFGGEDKFRNLFPPYVKGAGAALILYDTTRKKTLKELENWVKLVDENAAKDIVKILIGTKIDLKDKREISKEEAMQHSKDNKWDAIITETSAKTGENVEEAFVTIANEIVNRKLQVCKGCGDIFPKEAKTCNYCGRNV